MTQGKRTPEETKAYIIELKIKNLELSTHDIEKMLKWTEHEVSHDTISRILDDLRQLATSEKGNKQIERLDAIISGIEAITAKVVDKLSKQEEHTVNDVKTLNDISKTNFERRQLLTGKATSNVNVMKDASTEELLKQLEE